ncbi:MAG: hypothetical protein LW636_09710 [Planctomycetaceae bacterium]|nr:hypothetical protein [Planctomycetaceae bacterium]
MLYRFMRGFNEIYGVTVLFLFIGAFFVAFAFTLVYPLVPIVMLISSIFFVVGFRVFGLVCRGIERSLAREALGRGNCPACRTACDVLEVGAQRVHECPSCRRAFAATGDPFVPEESADPAREINRQYGLEAP